MTASWVENRQYCHKTEPNINLKKNIENFLTRALVPTTVREKIKVDKKPLEKRAEKHLLKLFGKTQKKNKIM